MAGVLLVCLGQGCAGGAARRDPTWARIQREGTLRVGLEASFPPFEWIDEAGQFRGLDVELAQALGQRWGVRVEFVNVHYDGLYDALKVARCDLIISALPYDRTLTRDVLYSESYFDAGQVLLVRQDGPPVRAVADIKGKRVAVELGSEGQQLLRQLARDEGLTTELVTGRTLEEVSALLREGAVDALVCDRLAALTLARQGLLRMVAPPLTHEPYVIAARRNAPRMIAEVNAALAEWRAGGFMEELLRRWL